MAIYHDEERLYSEHSMAAEAELLPCSLGSSRAILLYSGSWTGCHPGLSSGELAKTWNAEAEYCEGTLLREPSCGASLSKSGLPIYLFLRDGHVGRSVDTLNGMYS